MTRARITTPFTADSTAAEVIARRRPDRPAGRRHRRRSGIGVETARALAAAGAEVTLAVRNTAAGAAHRRRHHREHRQQARPRRAARPGRPRLRRGVRRRLGRPAAHPGQQRRRDGRAAETARRRAGSTSSPPTTSATSPWPSACTTRWPRPAAPGSSRSARRAHLRSAVVFDDIHFEHRRTSRGRRTGSRRRRTCCSPSRRPSAGRRRHHRQRPDAGRRSAPTCSGTSPRRSWTRLREPPAARRAVEDARAGCRHLGAAGGLAAARRRQRPVLRGLQRGRCRTSPAPAPASPRTRSTRRPRTGSGRCPELTLSGLSTPAAPPVSRDGGAPLSLAS